MKTFLAAAVMLVTTASIAFGQTSDVPPQIAAYTGTWDGQWFDRNWPAIDSTVIVGQFVKEDNVYTAPVIYTWRFSNGNGGRENHTGAVDPASGMLKVKFSATTGVEYQILDSQSIKGEWHRYGAGQAMRVPGTFKKKELQSYARGEAVAERPSPPKVEAPKALEQGVVAEKPPQKPTEQPVVAEAPVPSRSAEPVVVEKAAAQKEKTDRAQGITDMKKGEGGSEVKGSAGPSGPQRAASDLERCEKPIGTLAVVEPIHVRVALSRYHLGSTTGLIRLMVQQSNCFLVVERGIGMQNVMQERALAESGQLRQGSNIGGGQMITADYVMTPSVVFTENDAGGIGGALGGFIPGVGGALFSAIAGGLKFKEAETSLLVVDTRTSLQVASAEGSAKKADFALGGLLAAGGGGAALGGYSNTNEGKVVAASFLDNYNGIVRTVRGNPSLQREVRTLAEEAAARPKAGAAFNEGDVLRPKISNVKLLGKPSEAAGVVSVLAKSDEMIFLGKEQDGFVNVESAKGDGWVKKILVTR